MICGKCSEHHLSVAEVKYCYGIGTLEDALAPTGRLWGDKVRAVKPSEERREQNRKQLFEDIRMLGDQIPEGKYALRNIGTTGNAISFYLVDKPDRGRWAGSTFVKQLISDDEQRLPAERQLDVLTRIKADVLGAFALYGREIGKCGHCGRALTNDESRARGIGPICFLSLGGVA